MSSERFGRDFCNGYDIDAPELAVHLARVQMRIALETFLERIPDFRTAEGFVPEFEMGITRSMKTLPLQFTPVPAVAEPTT